MPILRQTQSGDWFVRYNVGQFYAAQVTPEGRDVLWHLGVREDGDFFDLGTFNRLRKLGFLVSNGGGGGPIAPDGPGGGNGGQDGGQDGGGRERWRRPFPLVFRRDDDCDDRWHLAIVVPPLAPEVAVAAAPMGATIRVSGTTVFASELWPGPDRRPSSGRLVVVPPSEHPYSVMPLGIWPPGANLWAGKIEGLNRAGGEIFALEEDGGERLAPDEPLQWGGRYIVVAPRVAYGHHPAIPCAALSPQWLGWHGGWQAWEIALPQHSDDSVCQWALHDRGWQHRVEAPPWRVRLVSPPLRFGVDKTPVASSEADTLLQLTPPPEAFPNPVPLKLCVMATGRPSQLLEVPRAPLHTQIVNLGRLPVGETLTIGLASDVESLTVRVETPPKTALPLAPTPLQVVVRTTEHVTVLDGIATSADAPMSAIAIDESASVSIECPVPLDVVWQSGQTRERRIGLSAARAGAQLAEAIAQAVTTHLDLIVELDAGAFGTIACRLRPPARTIAVVRHPAPRAAIRSRWIGFATRRPTYAASQSGLRTWPRRLLGHIRVRDSAERRVIVPPPGSDCG